MKQAEFRMKNLRTMKTQIKLTVLALLLSTINSQLSVVFAQGSLTPPGVPAPTMRSLAQIEPRTPIATAPFTISVPGSYYLTTNLTGSSGVNGITVASSHVALDLDGFTLLGASGSGNGILISGLCTNVTIRNGTVRGWGTNCVQVSSPLSRNLVFEHLNLSDSGADALFAFASVISDCTITGSGAAGLRVVFSTVHDCAVTACAGNAISAYNCTVRDCKATASGLLGIYITAGVVADCVVEDNQQSGIFVDANGCQILGNTCRGNNVNNNTNHADIFVNSSNNRLENNQVTAGVGNTNAGIAFVSGYVGNVIIRNSVFGHGAKSYSVIAGQQVIGPVITTYGTITNSNPWANFSY